MRVDYTTGQFYYNSSENRFEFVTGSGELAAKRWMCPCCVNKERSQVKGPKALKLFLKGKGVKSL